MFKSSTPPDSPWHSWRRAQRVGWVLWLGYIPGVIVLGRPLSSALGSEIAYLGVALAWMAACLLFSYWTGSFRCPRCGPLLSAVVVSGLLCTHVRSLWPAQVG